MAEKGVTRKHASEPSWKHHPGSSDGKGWRPESPVSYAPIFYWPPRPLSFLGWLFGFPGYLFGWNTVYFAITYVTWVYTQPAIGDCAKLSLTWILPMLARNTVLIWLVAGGWHTVLYTWRTHGTVGKYDAAWQAEGDAPGSDRFLMGSQTFENIALTMLSGVPIWTAYEAGFYWAWANGKLPYHAEWQADPLYHAALLVLIPIWREFHFYIIHRLSHWKPLYKAVHYVHHKNSNPGPWAGLAMHPVEHAMYFSVLLIHAVVPSHPLHMLFNAQHTGLTPALGHSGFHGPFFDGLVPGGSYFHYLHHRYFECNYGESTLVLDWLFGTFRDGSPKGAGSQLEGKEH